MEPIKRLIFGKEVVQEAREVQAQKNEILADKIQEELEALELWDQEAMAADLAESLDDEMLQDTFWTLLNVFMEYKQNPEDPVRFMALQRAGAQCQHLMGGKASESLRSVLDALTFRYEPVFNEVEEELERVVKGKKRDRTKSTPQNDIERYYNNVGFHRLPRSPSVWTNIDVEMPETIWSSGVEGNLTVRMTIAFPGQKEMTTEILLPWNDPGHADLEGTPPKAMCLAMAEVIRGEEVEGPLGRVAAEWVDQIKERVAELVQVSHTPEVIPSESVLNAMEQRTEEVKKESEQLLEVFEIFSERIKDQLPLREETIQVLDSLKERIREETHFESAIYIQNMLRVIIPTAVDIRSQFIGGDPVTYEDKIVLRAIGEFARLQESFIAFDPSLVPLCSKLSDELILKVALHPAAKAAFEAGMDPRDVLKYSDKLQNRESTINQLMVAVAEARSKAPFTTDYHVFKTEQMAKINELRERIALEEDLIRDGGLDEILSKIDRIISNTKTEAKSFDKAFGELKKFTKFTRNQEELLIALCTENPKLREHFAQAFAHYVEFHRVIHVSLLERGKLPENFYKLMEQNDEIGEKLHSLIAELQLENSDDMRIIDLSKLTYNVITNQAVFSNLQFFSDSARSKGLDLNHYREIYGEPEGRERTFMVSYAENPFTDLEAQRKEIGYYHTAATDNPKAWQMVKADWDPEVMHDDGYFQKGVCHIGRALFNRDEMKWGAKKETDVELDLTTLSMLDSKEKVENYFYLIQQHFGYSPEKTREKLKPELSDFSDDEKEAIIDHYIEFSDRVMNALYEVHYAILDEVKRD